MFQNLKLKRLKTNKHEKGKTYFCGYWNKTYKCIDIIQDKGFGEAYVVVWDDGRTVTHATKLDIKHDFEVIE